MDPNPVVRHICRAVRHWKQRLVDLDGVGADIPPALLTLNGPSLIGAHSLERVTGVTREASVITAIALTDCDLAALAFEAYADIDRRYSPDVALAPLFAAGDPAIVEAVMVTVGCRDGRWTSVGFPYAYNGRKVTWAPPRSTAGWADEVLARQQAALGAGFARQAERVGPAPMVAGSQLAIVDEIATEDMAMVSFAVMAPCPCGSGRTIEDCCARNN